MGVLNIWSSFPFKLDDFFQVEVEAVHTLCLEVMEDNGPYPYLTGNLVFVFQTWVLELNLLTR